MSWKSFQDAHLYDMSILSNFWKISNQKRLKPRYKSGNEKRVLCSFSKGEEKRREAQVGEGKKPNPSGPTKLCLSKRSE